MQHRLACLLAALTLAASACGSVSSNNPADAGEGQPDGGGNPNEPDASTEPGVVRITVYEDGAPLAQVDVVFHNPDGTVHESKLTNSQGQAESVLEPGGLVTVAQAFGAGDYQLTTIAGVKPGDDLVFGDQTAYDSTQLGSVSVTFPSSGLPAGADYAQVYDGCDSTYDQVSAGVLNPTAVRIFEDCIRVGNEVHVVAVVYDVMGQPLAFTHETNVALSGSPLSASVQLPAWRTDWGAITLTANNMPANVWRVSSELDLSARGTSYWPSDQPPDILAPPAGQPLTYDFRFAKGFADQIGYGLTLFRGTEDVPEGQQLWARYIDSPSTTETIDLATKLMPAVTVTSVTTVGGREGIGWSSTAPLTGADAIYSIAFWNVDPNSHQWWMLIPGDTDQFQPFPELPPTLADFRPPAGTPPAGPPAVIVFDMSNVADYDEFRNGLGLHLFDSGIPPGNFELRASLGGNFN
jgi:hypothetical protein